MPRKKKSEKQAPQAPPATLKPKISTNDFPERPKLKVKPRRSEPGPMTDGRGGFTSSALEMGVPDASFLAANLSVSEMAAIRERIEARRAAPKWRTLPDGSKIREADRLFGCVNGCAKWFWFDAIRTPEGSNCPICNSRAYADGGRLRLATDAEVKAWEAREKAAREKWMAGAPERERRAREYNRRQIEDGRA